MIRTLLAVAAAISLFWGAFSAQAQTNRVTYQGSFSIPGNEGQQPQSGMLVVDTPYVAFRARYTHESWILIGSPVHTCEIVWEFTDYQGRPSPDSVTIMGVDMDMTNPDVRFTLENHPDIVRAAQTPQGQNFVEVRLSAIGTAPKVWDLDFLVPTRLAASAPADDDFARRLNNANAQERAAFEQDRLYGREAFTRCISGALGASGRPGLNTPYAFDNDELLVFANSGLASQSLDPVRADGRIAGRFLEADDARRTFEYFTRGRVHSGPYEASGRELILLDAQFDTSTALRVVEGILRDAARTAETTRQSVAARLAEAEAARLEADRQSGATPRTADPRYRFDPNAPQREAFESLEARASERFAAALERRNPVQELQARNNPVVEPVPNPLANVGYVRFDETSDNLDALEAQARSLDTAASAFETWVGRLPQAQSPKDMTQYAIEDRSADLYAALDKLLANCNDSHRSFYDIHQSRSGDIITWRLDDSAGDFFKKTVSAEDLIQSIIDGRFILTPSGAGNLTITCDECIKREWSSGSNDIISEWSHLCNDKEQALELLDSFR